MRKEVKNTSGCGVLGIIGAVPIVALVIFLFGFVFTGRLIPPGREVAVIQPSEVLFLVPVTGDPNQQDNNFKGRDASYWASNEQLNTSEVAIDKSWFVNGGLLNLGGYYRPSQRAFIVPRIVTTREWTSTPDSGTSSNDDSIPVESSESIGYRLGIVISAQIEADPDVNGIGGAAAYLANYGQLDTPITQTQAIVRIDNINSIMDKQVRQFIEGDLFARFGKITLSEARNKKGDIIEASFQAAKAYFHQRGINIQAMGGTDGLVYDDDKIQAVINQGFTAAELQKQAAGKATETFIISDSQARSTLQAADAAATQQLIAAEAEYASGKVNAQSTLVAAQAQADAINQIGKAYADNPIVIQHEQVQQWNGNIPPSLGGNVQGYLNVEPLLTTPEPKPSPSP